MLQIIAFAISVAMAASQDCFGAQPYCGSCPSHTYGIFAACSCCYCTYFGGGCLDCNEDGCGLCAAGWYLDGQNQNCYSCTNFDDLCSTCSSDGCLECAEDYFLYNNQCYSCGDGCNQCNPASGCEQPSQGYYVDSIGQSTQCPNNPDNCLSCSADGCLQCANNYFLYGSSCSSCGEGCSQCNPSSGCLQVNQGYFINSTSQSAPCPGNCLSCSADSCSQCADNYFLYGSSCSSCGNGCKQCSSSSGCLQASQGYFINSIGQSSECPNNCLSCENGTSCTTCQNKFVLINENCIEASAFSLAPLFNLTDILNGHLVFSLGQNKVTNCAGTQEIWSTYTDNLGHCHDVADQTPTFDFQGSNTPNQQVLIAFDNVTGSQRTFQLVVNITCSLANTYTFPPPFTVSLFANSSAGSETFRVNGSSIYACPMALYKNTTLHQNLSNACGPIFVGSNYIFNLCPLNKTGLYNISDILGGSLSFSLTTSPKASCSKDNNDVWGVYYDNADNCYEVATQDPTYSLLSEEDPDQGIQITYPVSISQSAAVRNFQLVVNLSCDIYEVNPFDVNFTMDLFATDVNDIEIITVEGKSIYGCRDERDALDI